MRQLGGYASWVNTKNGTSAVQRLYPALENAFLETNTSFDCGLVVGAELSTKTDSGSRQR